MGSNKQRMPDFFDEEYLDPVRAATGESRNFLKTEGEDASEQMLPGDRDSQSKAVVKKKAGFYLSLDLLERFTSKFYELKLAGIHIENKSALIEAALAYTLDDIDRGERSEVLRRLRGNANTESDHRMA